MKSTKEIIDEVLKDNFVVLTANQIYRNVELAIESRKTGMMVMTGTHEFISVTDFEEYFKKQRKDELEFLKRLNKWGINEEKENNIYRKGEYNVNEDWIKKIENRIKELEKEK